MWNFFDPGQMPEAAGDNVKAWNRAVEAWNTFAQYSVQSAQKTAERLRAGDVTGAYDASAQAKAASLYWAAYGETVRAALDGWRAASPVNAKQNGVDAGAFDFSKFFAFPPSADEALKPAAKSAPAPEAKSKPAPKKASSTKQPRRRNRRPKPPRKQPLAKRLRRTQASRPQPQSRSQSRKPHPRRLRTIKPALRASLPPRRPKPRRRPARPPSCSISPKARPTTSPRSKAWVPSSQKRSTTSGSSIFGNSPS